MKPTYALAADIGGTTMRVGLVDRAGRVSQRSMMPTRPELGPHDAMRRLADAFGAIVATVGRAAVSGLGLSLASPTDPRTGALHSPPNLPGWDGFAPALELAGPLDLPTYSANDATLAALAEHACGAGAGMPNIVYLTLSTGVGGGIIIGGRVYAGASGLAGEFGHMTVDPNGPRCNCGGIGCLEAMASGTAIARMTRARLLAGEASLVTRLVEGDLGRVDARVVAEAAAQGDKVCRETMDAAGASLGIGLANLINSLDPDLIILGGGLSNSLDLLMPGAERELEARVIARAHRRVSVVRSALGDDACLIGAGLLALGDEALGEPQCPRADGGRRP